MGPAFANLLEIGGEGRHEKRPDIEVICTHFLGQI